MSTLIRHFIDRFYSVDNGYTVTILGLRSSGKTTLLYLLKSGEVIRATPSVGFNVEAVMAPTASGRDLRMTGWDIGLGCADFRQMLVFINMYTAKADALVWVVDSCDQDSLSESVDTFADMIKGVDSERSGSRKDYPILILATKQDRPEAMTIDDIRKAFSKTLSGRTACVFKVSLTQPIPQGGLLNAFEWLLFALETAPAGRSKKPVQSMPDPRSSTTLAQKLELWLTRVDKDSSPEDFIAQFQSISLPSWDHYTHIRIAYVLLTTHGRQKGKDMIFDGIEKYIARSSQTRGRTFHVTMTYFWIQIVHLSISTMPKLSLSSDLNVSYATSGLVVGSQDDFAAFLLLSPYVADGNLWTDYYSKEVMMSPEAKGGMVLPDKKPLPNLVVRDAI